MKVEQNNKLKILVLFVEPMLYGMDLIEEVYKKTEHEFFYLFANDALTRKDKFALPKNSFVCYGKKTKRKKQVNDVFSNFKPDFAIINGYVGLEQTVAIKNCKRNKIKYAIEADTPLNVPKSKIKAIAKKLYLKSLLNCDLCYGFPGGTLQKENFIYYGIPEEKCFIMPMSVSRERLRTAFDGFNNKSELKKEYGVENKKVFLFTGRLEKVKNVQLLLRAFALNKKNFDDMVLFIVGDGSLKNELEGLVFEEDIKDVYFVGYAVFPDNVKYYKMADVFVLPSSYEPWGLVVNEAMTLGLPVIVSSAVGCRVDLVKDNGVIFESDNLIELARAIEKFVLVEDKENSDNSLRIINSWNYTKYLENFLGALNKICKK